MEVCAICDNAILTTTIMAILKATKQADDMTVLIKVTLAVRR